MSTSQVSRPTATASAAKATSPRKARSPSKKTTSPTKRAISPRKVLFPTKAVPGKSCFKRTVVTSPSKKPSSSSSAKKKGSKYFSFATSDNVQVMKIPFIDRSRKIQPATRIISPEKKPAHDFTKPLEPSKVQKTAAKNLKVIKHAGCVVSPKKKPSKDVAEQPQLAKLLLPDDGKVKIVKHVSSAKEPLGDHPEQSELAKIRKAVDKKLRTIKWMIWNWKQNGAVNGERLKKIQEHIDRTWSNCTEAERKVLSQPLRPILEEVDRLAYELEKDDAKFEVLHAFKLATAKAKVTNDRSSERLKQISIEQFDVPLDYRTSAEVASDNKSLQLLMAVRNHRKASPSKKAAMLTKEWTFGPVVLSWSCWEHEQSVANDGPGITVWLFILLLVVLVLAQIY